MHFRRGVCHVIAFEFPQKRWPGDPQDARCLALVVACSCERLFDRRAFDVAESRISIVQQSRQVAPTIFFWRRIHISAGRFL